MTPRELNRDIKRLVKLYNSGLNHNQLRDFEKEYKRLYYADSDFKYCNKESILIMFSINQRHRFIALHSFGLNIEI